MTIIIAKNVSTILATLSYFLCELFLAESYTVRPSTAIERVELLGVWRVTSSTSLLRKAFAGHFQSDCGDFSEVDADARIREKRFGVHNCMKEFTNFSSVDKTKNPNQDKHKEQKRNSSMLIRLKDNGSFEMISSDSEVYEKHLGVDQFDSTLYEDNQSKSNSFKEYEKGGRWHFEDGNIVLAPFIPRVDDKSELLKQYQREHDMLLCGQILCCGHEKEAFELKSESLKIGSQNKKGKKEKLEKIPMQFSIPYGSIESGRYMYPLNHRSFFDLHPIFKPNDIGHFQMQKIISETPENDEVEKYTIDDLAGKRFFITAEPLKKKKKERWSRSLGKVVEVMDENRDDEIDFFVSNMQVMEVELFRNHTFTTVAGLGSTVVLRGRWDIIGQDKDQIWLQVWRFGFGRSVSGSTYSEGAQLTQNDDKGYWGVITQYEIDDENDLDSHDSTQLASRFEIRGMVLLGYGLEPTTIGKFTMIECTCTGNGNEKDMDDNDVIQIDDDIDNLGVFQ